MEVDVSASIFFNQKDEKKDEEKWLRCVAPTKGWKEHTCTGRRGGRQNFGGRPSRRDLPDALTAIGDANSAGPVPVDDTNDDDWFDDVAVEKSQFLLRLAPRIRRPESNTSEYLVGRLEGLLEGLLVQVWQLAEYEECHDDNGKRARAGWGLGTAARRSQYAVLLLTAATCLSALAILLWGSRIVTFL
jgi:hypothetical protein